MSGTIEVQLQIVNAFVDDGQGGNPAGVVLDAERFSREQKQRIAALAGLSETAFISQSDCADFKLEFFTPNRQIAHCGHATIASFSYLRQIGRISGAQSSKETIDGRREIFLDGEMAFMEQRAPRYTDIGEASEGVDATMVLASLGLDRSDLMDGQVPSVVNTGNNFLVIPLKSESSLAKIRPDFDTIESISEKLDLIGYYPFSLDTRVPGRQAGARMFAPRFGIPEESATGMAAGPLACILFDRIKIRTDGDILIEQGHLMSPPSPSIIHARLSLSNGRIDKLAAGGKARLAGTRLIILQ
ncbi:MAG TPA: PhzF family phenazine biosynthesis protein [Noviherbaspirillum sp.]|nr:PhzF family phenazine biosynthesis protein [Noviherbaspirillum sp.]